MVNAVSVLESLHLFILLLPNEQGVRFIHRVTLFINEANSFCSILEVQTMIFQLFFFFSDFYLGWYGHNIALSSVGDYNVLVRNSS